MLSWDQDILIGVDAYLLLKIFMVLVCNMCASLWRCLLVHMCGIVCVYMHAYSLSSMNISIHIRTLTHALECMQHMYYCKCNMCMCLFVYVYKRLYVCVQYVYTTRTLTQTHTCARVCNSRRVSSSKYASASILNMRWLDAAGFSECFLIS